MSKIEEITEITIPVPWGHISAKTWGSSKQAPVLVIHGLQDNAGSFDALIPKLTQSNYYVCIDLPCHGKSSYFPPYTPVTAMLFIISIKYVVDYFKWDKFSIIAHSLGGRIAVNFAFIYPELLNGLITIDVMSPHPQHPQDYRDIRRTYIENFQNIMYKLETNSPPEYTYDEVLSRVMERRPTVICKEGAINMLKRALIPAGNDKFYLTMDQRLKQVFHQPLSKQDLALIARYSRFKFPHLILIASESREFFLECELILKEFKKNKNFKMIVLNGNHDIHNNNPDLVASYINKFFDKKFQLESKL